MNNYQIIRTAESVSPSHPDKLCDRIADSILDRYLELDPESRVAIEVMGMRDKILVAGEVTSKASIRYIDAIDGIVRSNNFCIVLGEEYETEVRVNKQSPEIARGVDTGGAGDQGIMVGYACRETPEFLPKEYVIARNLNRFIYGYLPYDGKTQATLNPNGEVDLVASFQNSTKEALSDLVLTYLNQEPLLSDKLKHTSLHINPAGDWNIGGFEADTGLTGRKIIVDNYGPRIPVGGGAFSGKDPSKVDRSAAYMARRIAVDYLKSNPKEEEALVYLAYAIGKAEPLQATVNGNPVKGYDLTPNGIIDFLDLKKPIYSKTAEWGHFGNGFKWG